MDSGGASAAESVEVATGAVIDCERIDRLPNQRFVQLVERVEGSSCD